VIAFLEASTATISADCTIATTIDNDAGDGLPTETRPPPTPDSVSTLPVKTKTTNQWKLETRTNLHTQPPLSRLRDPCQHIPAFPWARSKPQRMRRTTMTMTTRTAS
jgi:hypothetical protein